jgi:hypothetical protein
MQLPAHNQYDPPPEVSENQRRHLMAIGAIDPDFQTPVTHAGESDGTPPSKPASEVQPQSPLNAYMSQLGPRSQAVVKSDIKAVDRLLTWFHNAVHGKGAVLEINANGFAVNVSVMDINLESGKLIVTISKDTGVSFALDDGVTLKLRWGGAEEWTPYLYLAKIDPSSGFPFFFMVFLAD